jgi:TonB-linked SusC/RagA family outer membrane protein
MTVLAQAQVRKVQGTVVDAKGEAIIGASVVVTGTPRGTATDVDGKFSLDVAPKETLTVSYIGYVKEEVEVAGKTEVVIVLKETEEMLGDVVVVAFGTQKKESLTSAIQTINPKELKVPSSNLTTALAGRIAGLIGYQRSGEPGQDNADFFIRGVTTFGYKKDPLILIDGIETTATELARLTPDDVEAFSILKDATATALYGARGANGVVQIKTKEGKEGPAKVSIRFENSFSSNTQNIELADPVTFMRLNNEARNARSIDGFTSSRYSEEKIDQTARGANPLMYPANDWRKLLTKDVASNQRANMNISGGGGVARYYIAASYARDNGNLSVDKQNNFNNNIDLRTYQLRSNINLNMTKTTEAIVRLSGSFDDYAGPLDGGSDMYRKVLNSNPVEFPAYYPASLDPQTDHILFGNAPRGNTNAGYMNPYADLVKGYKESSKSLIDAAFELKQDLNFITKGLNARALFNTTRYAFFDVSRSYNPYYYGVLEYDRMTDQVSSLKLLNADNNPTEYLGYTPGSKDVNSTIYIEAVLNYSRIFNKVHDVSGLLVYQNREQLYSNKETLQLSLPYRNQGVSGRFTYGYDSRYLIELNFGYNGSERFHKSERFGFFPAVGGGWILSNEKFWENFKSAIPKLKFKGTYGLVGNDAIGDENDRFFYLSEMNMDDGGRGYAFGYVNNSPYSRNGVRIRRYENQDISWEKAYKTNLGFEINLFNDFEIQADYFTEHRTNILMTRSSIPSTMGLSADIRSNLGEAKAYGVDASIDYNKYFSSGYWIQSRANFTFAHSEYSVFEQPEYKEKYKYRVGNPINQQYGLIAERLFVDEYEVMNSPRQTYGEYRAGDIKYRDVNGDGVITDLDIVPLGYPDVPEIVYGFGISTGNAYFDFSVFFQGQARSSFWIDAAATTPFRHISDNGERDIPLLKAYADSYWSENNRDLYAVWPRLSEDIISNNTQRSSWFMRDGSFLRLKTVEVGFKFPEKLLKKMYLDNLRVYASGNNLLLLSGFDIWDIEMGGSGIGYPIQRVINVGLQIGF